MKKQFKATFSDGTTKARKSEAEYTFAWRVRRENDTGADICLKDWKLMKAGAVCETFGFSKTLENAEKAAGSCWSRCTSNEDLNSRNQWVKSQVRKYKADFPAFVKKLEAITRVEIVECSQLK